MIARWWHGVVPVDRAEAYRAYLARTGGADYAATPGNAGVYLLGRAEEAVYHVAFLTLWENGAAIRAFAGPDASVARYYPEDDAYLLARAPHVDHAAVQLAPPPGWPGGIVRRWTGDALPAHADAYEALLRQTVLPGFAARDLPGYTGAVLLRHDTPEASCFTTLLGFSAPAQLTAFAGPDAEAAVVPPAAQALLHRYDARAQHYHVLPLTP